MRETKILNEPSEAAQDKTAELLYQLNLKYGKELMKEKGVKESA